MEYSWTDYCWESLGILGALIFCGRFYLQWYISERRKRSVVPIGFWYMSSAGSLMLLPYAVFHLASPLGALSHSFNIVVYARNLIHIWRNRNALSRRTYWLVHGSVMLIVLTAVCLMSYTWWGEWKQSSEAPAAVMRSTWLWLAIGVAGQGLFACRFLIQWLVTETQKKSVVPLVFWYISLAAATLMGLSYLNRPQPEWLLALTVAAPMPVYFRNLWLIHRSGETRSESDC